MDMRWWFAAPKGNVRPALPVERDFELPARLLDFSLTAANPARVVAFRFILHAYLAAGLEPFLLSALDAVIPHDHE
jgi:hypothetical protein